MVGVKLGEDKHPSVGTAVTHVVVTVEAVETVEAIVEDVTAREWAVGVVTAE